MPNYSHRPQEMIALKRDLASTVRRYGDAFERQLFDGVGPLDAGGRKAMRRLTMDRIDHSEPVFVADNVLDELRSRTLSAAPYRLGSVAPFSQRGFAWFSRPIHLTPSWAPEMLPAWGLSWGTGLVPTTHEAGIVNKSGVAVLAWGKVEFQGEGDNPNIVAVPMGYGIAAFGGWFRSESFPEMLHTGTEAPVFFDGDRGDSAAGTNIVTLAHSLWSMMDERVLVRARARLGRKEMRLAKRAGLSDTFVTTVHLRAREYVGDPKDGPSGSREYGYRFPVRGHVRTLHRGTERERQVTVRAHVKGPKDKPLVIPERVYSLDT